MATLIERAFKRGYNSYRIDGVKPPLPAEPDALVLAYNQGWEKAERYHERQSDLLRSRNF